MCTVSQTWYKCISSGGASESQVGCVNRSRICRIDFSKKNFAGNLDQLMQLTTRELTCPLHDFSWFPGGYTMRLAKYPPNLGDDVKLATLSSPASYWIPSSAKPACRILNKLKKIGPRVHSIDWHRYPYWYRWWFWFMGVWCKCFLQKKNWTTTIIQLRCSCSSCTSSFSSAFLNTCHIPSAVLLQASQVSTQASQQFGRQLGRPEWQGLFLKLDSMLPVAK